jgi:hypothetical protein
MSESKSSYPHAELTKLTTKPNLRSLTTLFCALNENAASVHSDRGGGANGYLWLAMPDVDFMTMAGAAPVVIPQHPGPHPGHVVGVTNHVMVETNRLHKEAVEEFKSYTQVNRDLKEMLLKAIPEAYLEELKDDNVGFTNSSTLDIVTFLKTRYGIVKQHELTANENKMSEAWNPEDAIETLYSRIAKCQAFARTHNPISDNTAVRKMLVVVEQTNLFDDTVRDWNKRPANEWTMANFKADFSHADDHRRGKQKTTSESVGFHSANATINNTTASTGTVGSTVHDFYYCWSHGLGINSTHTSATCNTKRHGHQDTATLGNMMGGNNTIIRQRGEQVVYRNNR